MSDTSERIEIERKIRNACKGISYISETDSLVEYFAANPMKEFDLKFFLQAIGRPDEKYCEEVDASAFFERLTKTKSWQSEEEKNNVRRFARLQKVLFENLKDIRVYKIGRIKVDVFVAGVGPDGLICGVKMKAVET